MDAGIAARSLPSASNHQMPTNGFPSITTRAVAVAVARLAGASWIPGLVTTCCCGSVFPNYKPTTSRFSQGKMRPYGDTGGDAMLADKPNDATVRCTASR